MLNTRLHRGWERPGHGSLFCLVVVVVDSSGVFACLVGWFGSLRQSFSV